MKKILSYSIILIISLMPGCSEKEEPVPDEEGKIIVLMYHRLVEGEAENLYERSVEDFEADLKYLINNNVNVIGFDDLEIVSKTGKMPLGNSAIISFDDGDNSWYMLAAPLLLKYNMKATFFLWTYMIGSNSFLTWEEVEYLSNYTLPGGKRPFVFGSHTFSHPFLYQRRTGFSTFEEYNSFLDYELRESKLAIEAHTPGEVNILALPYGDGAGDPDIIAAAERNGYKFIRTSIWGAIDNPDINNFVIPSLPILDSTSPDEIGRYLAK